MPRESVLSLLSSPAALHPKKCILIHASKILAQAARQKICFSQGLSELHFLNYPNRLNAAAGYRGV
jgi:hypothetical protein